MKKIIFTLLFSLLLVSLIPVNVQAQVSTSCNESTVIDPATGLPRGGLVPCGNTCKNPNNGNIVECGTCNIGNFNGLCSSCQPGDNCVPSVLACRCELAHVFILALNVYNFIVKYIATPLAALLVVVGGALMLISGGPGGANPITGIASPNLYSTAKNIIMTAILGIILIFSSWVIINVVMMAIGYGGAWQSFPI